MKDLYKILGVSENADPDTIKKAYRKLAKEFHPDVTGGDKRKTERFKDVNEAYAVLGEDKKRAEYDRLRHAPLGSDGMPQGFDPDTFAEVFGGAGGPFRGRVRVSTPAGEMGGDLGDLFASLFGNAGPFGGRTRARTQQPRGQDMVMRLEITLPEAALGTVKKIRSGQGSAIDVQVPPGVETGGRLRLAGHGARAPEGGAPGNLHLEVTVAPHPHLRRSNDDIELDLPLTVGEAVLGTRVDVPTVDGNVRVTVPPGTSCGAKLRLRGKGVKRPDGSRGDQICHMQIVVPKLRPEDEESRRLVEELDRRTRGAPVRRW